MAKADKLWRAAPAPKDLKSATRYLSLLCADPAVQQITRGLAHAPTVRASAKDLLRASNLPLLPREESHVKDDLKRLRKGKTLSPVLLVRGDIADGYHRICAVCYFDEDAPVACRLAPLQP
jgi:hypothetical protein